MLQHDLVAEDWLSEEDLRHAINYFVKMLQLADRVRQRNANDAISAERSHLSPLAGANHLVCLDAEARREYSIKSSRRSAALHVSEFCHPRLQIRAAFNLRR